MNLIKQHAKQMVILWAFSMFVIFSLVSAGFFRTDVEKWDEGNFSYGYGYGTLGYGYGYGYGTEEAAAAGYYQGNDTIIINDPSTEMPNVSRVSGDDIEITQTVEFTIDTGVGVSLPEWLVISWINVTDLALIAAVTGSTEGLTSPSAWAVEFGIADRVLTFSVPITITINVGTNDPVYPRIKHFGGDWWIDWLTTNSSATCTDWLPEASDSLTLSSTVTPSANIITIYTCSASTVSAATSYSVWGDNNNGGGWSSPAQDSCPNGDLSASFYDGKCEISTVPNNETGSTSWSTFSAELDNAYLYAYHIGITTMATIQTANIEWHLIRAHMAKMLVNYAVKVLGLQPNTWLNCAFNDITDQSAEMKWYIKLACQLGMMGQGISDFNPNGEVTRAEFGTALSRALYGNTYNNGTPYYTSHLNALKANGIITNTDPTLKEVRGRVMLMLMRADK